MLLEKGPPTVKSGNLVTAFISLFRNAFGIYFYEERGKFYFIDHETKNIWRFTQEEFRNVIQTAINAVNDNEE